MLRIVHDIYVWERGYAVGVMSYRPLHNTFVSKNEGGQLPLFTYVNKFQLSSVKPFLVSISTLYIEGGGI